MPEEEKKQPSKAELDMQAYQDSYKANTPQVTQGTQQTPPTQQTPATQETQRTPGKYEASATRVTAPVINKIDTTELENNLAEQNRLAIQQSDARIDRATQQGEQELRDQWENAQEGYRTQQNQISRDEAQAKDNSALYSEMKGDRGGIGRAQYDAIQNNAATNRLNVQRDQQKMAADIQKQITQLRANGEFQKADALLSMTQSYLAQLQQLWQWSIQTNLSVEEMNAQMQQWEDQFNENAKQFGIQMDWQAARAEREDYVTDRNYWRGVYEFDETKKMQEDQFKKTYGLNYLNYLLDKSQVDFDQDPTSWSNKLKIEQVRHSMALEDANQAANTNSRNASNGWNLLEVGVMPSAEQLEAMGMNQSQAQVLADAYKAAFEANNAGDTGTPVPVAPGPGGYTSGDPAADLFAVAAGMSNPLEYIKTHAADYGLTPGTELQNDYKGWIEDGKYDEYLAAMKTSEISASLKPLRDRVSGSDTDAINAFIANGRIGNQMRHGSVIVDGKEYTPDQLSAAVAEGTIVEQVQKDAKGNKVTYYVSKTPGGGSQPKVYTALK